MTTPPREQALKMPCSPSAVLGQMKSDNQIVYLPALDLNRFILAKRNSLLKRFPAQLIQPLLFFLILAQQLLHRLARASFLERSPDYTGCDIHILMRKSVYFILMRNTH
jgi:hypothetical protein